MALPTGPKISNPTCKRCGRFLRTEEERQRQYCSRCPLPPPAPAGAPEKEEIFCCGSDPPCPLCPYVVGWDNE